MLLAIKRFTNVKKIYYSMGFYIDKFWRYSIPILYCSYIIVKPLNLDTSIFLQFSNLDASDVNRKAAY